MRIVPPHLTKVLLQELNKSMSISDYLGFSGESDGKESAGDAGDSSSIPGLGRSPGEYNGYPLQHSCLENSMDRGAWRAIVCGAAKSWTGLSNSYSAYFSIWLIKIANYGLKKKNPERTFEITR